MAQINKPTDYFNTKLYTGTGSSLGVTGVGFQPDLVWLKSRNATYNHALFDIVRGTGKYINSNTTTAEGSTATSLSAFDSDGFTVVSDGFVNNSGTTFASWNWLASNTTTSNTDGTATSTVSANTTSGFSIVKWTQSSGATFGHGLNQAPEIFIHKRTSNTGQWVVFTDITGSIQYLELNSTIASSSTSVTWDSTTFTNFTGDTGDWISYCFHSVKGFSKMGTYTGNGSTDGTFVYTGFKPAFIIVKRTDSASDWVILDNKRNSFNVVDKKLESSNSDADTTQTACDFLSNGIKLKDTTTSYLGTNISGGTYIYMCFAESPLVGTNNIPATAR